MSPEEQKLHDACFQVARTTMWQPKPVDVEAIKSLTEKLYSEATLRLEISTGCGASMALVTRAVHYLEQAHAIPPMRDDINWFSDMLSAVLEVACPNSGLKGEGRAFLKDMLRGISTFVSE